MAANFHVPGYEEALAREQQLREEAYLGLPQVVAGVRLRQITPRLLNLLCVIQSPWVQGGAITPDESVRFLWTLASDFSQDAKGKRQFANGYILYMLKNGLDWEYVFDCIGEFVEVTFMDAPEGGGNSTPYVCSTAWMEVKMKQFMGWESELTLDTPLRRIYQLLRCERIMEGDRTLVNKFSDKANDEWLKAAMADPNMIAEIQRAHMRN